MVREVRWNQVEGGEMCPLGVGEYRMEGTILEEEEEVGGNGRYFRGPCGI